MLNPLKKKKKKSASNPQGITVKGSALGSAATLALIVILAPVLLGFTYLIALRDPGVNEQQLQRVSQSFAAQQASNIHSLLAGMKTRLQGAAQSPLALQAIANELGKDVALVEQAMLDYFPEVISLRLLPMGEMGTAGFEGGNQGLRNHIEVDLVRRARAGGATLPESYQFEGKWLTSIAQLATHPRVEDRNAVVIATIDNSVLASAMQSLDTASGNFTLQQKQPAGSNSKSDSVIAQHGSAGNAGIDFTQTVAIPDSIWSIKFTPSDQLVAELQINGTSQIAVLAICVLAILIGLLIVLKRYPPALARQVEKVIAAADRKTPLELSVPELVTVAKQLRRATLRNLRQTSAPEPEIPVVEFTDSSDTDLTNPMFQLKNIIDEEDEVLDLDSSAAPSTTDTEASISESGFPDHIFRAYDIRGVAQTELPDELVAKIGAAIGSVAGEADEQTVIVACDGRTSSPRIKAALIKSLMGCGRDVIDIGLVPTPLLYFATRHLNCHSGVMVTGSHNPAEYNGLKIVIKQQTIAAGGIQDIRERVIAGKFKKGTGRMIREDVVPAYIEEVISDIAIAVPLKVVIDAGNGATSRVAPELFEELGCEVVPLYCELDGRFPNRSPDTSNEDNLSALVAAVQAHEADFGVAFDGDGDRLAVVSPSGQIIRSDVLLMIYAEDVVSRNPGADVVFDVKCSRNLAQLITRHGGRPVLWKTGHAFMKEKMVETGALLGGEFSGHMFFGERWYGFDDGMYAAGRLAEILSTHGDSLDDTLASFPTSINTPELIVPVPENRKFALIEKFTKEADFANGKVNTLDGLRVDFQDGWGLLRASNTSAALTARFEADTQEALERIQEDFRSQVAAIATDLELNF
jgi:phosphomannomutase/phosphoglucomutase